VAYAHAVAILEQVQSNLFKTRIYPIPARGTRRVRVKYQEILRPQGDGVIFETPFALEVPAVSLFRFFAVFAFFTHAQAGTESEHYLQLITSTLVHRKSIPHVVLSASRCCGMDCIVFIKRVALAQDFASRCSAAQRANRATQRRLCLLHASTQRTESWLVSSRKRKET
jgi:hypothetical protein